MFRQIHVLILSGLYQTCINGCLTPNGPFLLSGSSYLVNSAGYRWTTVRLLIQVFLPVLYPILAMQKWDDLSCKFHWTLIARIFVTQP